MRLKTHAWVFEKSRRRFWTVFFGGGGGEGGMMTTVLRKHTKQYHHKSRFTRYLQYFRDVGPSHIVTNCTLDFANWTLGFAVAFGEKLEIGWGEACF